MRAIIASPHGSLWHAAVIAPPYDNNHRFAARFVLARGGHRFAVEETVLERTALYFFADAAEIFCADRLLKTLYKNSRFFTIFFKKIFYFSIDRRNKTLYNVCNITNVI